MAFCSTANGDFLTLTPFLNQNTPLDLNTSYQKEKSNGITGEYTNSDASSPLLNSGSIKGFGLGYFKRMSDPLLVSASYAKLTRKLEYTGGMLDSELQAQILQLRADYQMPSSKRWFASLTQSQITDKDKVKMENFRFERPDRNHNFMTLNVGGMTQVEDIHLGVSITPKSQSKKTVKQKVFQSHLSGQESLFSESEITSRWGNGDIIRLAVGKVFESQLQGEFALIKESENQESADASSQTLQLHVEKQLSKQFVVSFQYGTTDSNSITIDNRKTEGGLSITRQLGAGLVVSPDALITFSYDNSTFPNITWTGMTIGGTFFF